VCVFDQEDKEVPRNRIRKNDVEGGGFLDDHGVGKKGKNMSRGVQRHH
jgi:hypothetical protein